MFVCVVYVCMCVRECMQETEGWLLLSFSELHLILLKFRNLKKRCYVLRMIGDPSPSSRAQGQNLQDENFPFLLSFSVCVSQSKILGPFVVYFHRPRSRHKWDFPFWKVSFHVDGRNFPSCPMATIHFCCRMLLQVCPNLVFVELLNIWGLSFL